MSYTTTQQVRHHLSSGLPVSEIVSNQPVVMSRQDWVSFHDGAIDPDTLAVKTIRTLTRTRQNIAAVPETTVLSQSSLVPGSVLVASDSSLGRIYVENQDYVIRYRTGEMLVKSGGSIPLGSAVTVWFIPFVEYITGEDFDVRADRGKIKATTGGAILEQETVWLDYRPVHVGFSDALIQHAVNTANGLIEEQVDRGRQFGANPMLAAAATYRAMELLCHIGAARTLSTMSDSDRVSAAWLNLAERYAAQHREMIAAFRPPKQSPANPSRV